MEEKTCIGDCIFNITLLLTRGLMGWIDYSKIDFLARYYFGLKSDEIRNGVFDNIENGLFSYEFYDQETGETFAGDKKIHKLGLDNRAAEWPSRYIPKIWVRPQAEAAFWGEEILRRRIYREL